MASMASSKSRPTPATIRCAATARCGLPPTVATWNIATARRFCWLADTWWMGLCDRLAWPEDFQRLTADRREKGFNVIQIVAGLYPDMPAFDQRGRNEAGFPWERTTPHSA